MLVLQQYIAAGSMVPHHLRLQTVQIQLTRPSAAVLVCRAPLQELSEWACIYIRYLQIFRQLETAYDQMLQPQKRQDMKKALEACMGRMLEIRHWMVRVDTPW